MPVPRGQFGHDDNLFQYSQNIQKAKELMAEAGFPNGVKEKLIYTYAAENQVEKAFSPLVKEALAKIGLDVEIRPMIWNAQFNTSFSSRNCFLCLDSCIIVRRSFPGI